LSPERGGHQTSRSILRVLQEEGNFTVKSNSDSRLEASCTAPSLAFLPCLAHRVEFVRRPPW
jgi:hypothetical protein